MILTPDLALEYDTLWDAAVILPDKRPEVKLAASRALLRKDIYERVAGAFKMPWEVVAAIHNLECSQRFDQHLHNGDSLKARTKRVPAGRPKEGEPPFTWEDSARDALSTKGPEAIAKWDIPHALWFLERYNGWGYRTRATKPGVPKVLSPYLWSFTDRYRAGKYVADGRFSSTAVSAQVGAVALLKALGWEGEM